MNISTPRAYFGVILLELMIFSGVSYLIQTGRKSMYLAVNNPDQYTNYVIIFWQIVNIMMAIWLVPKEKQFFGAERLWVAFGRLLLTGWVGLVVGVLLRNYLDRWVFDP